MSSVEKTNREYYTIDLMHIVKTLWKRAWAIVLSGIICAAIGFSLASFVISPKYSSSIMLYVNNSSLSIGSTSFSISSSELTAAQSLAKTYTVILKNRTSLNQVIEKSGVSYTYEQLDKMITAATVNDTEVLRITVMSEDPYEAAKIVNCIAEVLPARIAEIIEGASMEVVDSGVANTKKIEPSITKYTAIGLALGVFVSVVIFALFALLDNTIHDEEYILRNYNYPILAKIPYLYEEMEMTYGYNYNDSRKKKSN